MSGAALRASLAAIGLLFACGVYAQEKSGADRKLSSDDRAFILQATNGGMNEVELSRIALQGSARPDVKSFAQRMVDDHGKAGKELAALAAKLGAPPHKPAVDPDGDLKRFAQLRADKLDGAYVDRMVGAHKGAIALFEKQASRGDAGELKEFASKALPTLKEHLKMAMALAEKK